MRLGGSASASRGLKMGCTGIKSGLLSHSVKRVVMWHHPEVWIWVTKSEIDQTDRRGMTTEKERAFEKGEWRRFLLLKVVYTRDHQRNSPDNGAKKVHNMTQWTKKSKRPPHVSSELPIFQFQWNHQTKTKLVELHMNILYKNLYIWPQSSGQSPRLSAGHPPFTMFQLVVNGKRIERTIGLVPVHTNMQIYSTPDVTVNKPATWSRPGLTLALRTTNRAYICIGQNTLVPYLTLFGTRVNKPALFLGNEEWVVNLEGGKFIM